MKRLAGLVLALAGAVAAGASGAVVACGPFTDVAVDAFCPFVLEIFYLGITTGTTATTYDPTANVTRLQMAAFLSRTVDATLRRGSRRAALDHFWTPKNETVVSLTTVGTQPTLLQSDGADVWVAANGLVTRVRASDGRSLETWTGVVSPFGVLVAMGRVFVSGNDHVYQIDPSQPAGAVTAVTGALAVNVDEMTFDGARIWTANFGPPASVSILTPGPTVPWTATTVTAGFDNPWGALFDGSNVWVTERNSAALRKLSSSGAVLQTVTVGNVPGMPVFDGTNIWVPNANDTSVSVVRAASGAVLATLSGNGLNGPFAAAFDGQRVLVTNGSGDSVSLWKAADLSPLGNVFVGAVTAPFGACSDGIDFWVTLKNAGKVMRF